MPPLPFEPSPVIERLYAGDPTAANELVDRYGWQMRKIVRRHLTPEARRSVDSLDVTARAWEDFFLGKMWEKLKDPETLSGFLCGVARNSARRANREATAQKRTPKREVPLAWLAPDEDYLADPEPTPAQAAEVADLWDRLLLYFDPVGRAVLEALAQGHTATEAAELNGLSRHAVGGLLFRARAILEPRRPGD